MRGGARSYVEPHRHEGVYIMRGKEDAVVTKNLVPGVSVYNEKRVSVDVRLWPSPSPFFSFFLCASLSLSHSCESVLA